MLRVLTIALLCSAPVTAEAQTVPVGTRIRVTTAATVSTPGVVTMNGNEPRRVKPGTRIAGTLASLDRDRLVIVAAGRQLLIPREAIAVIELSSTSRSRRERATLGAMIGAASGAGFVLGMRAGCKGDCFSVAPTAALAAAMFGGIGAMLGAVERERWTAIPLAQMLYHGGHCVMRRDTAPGLEPSRSHEEHERDLTVFVDLRVFVKKGGNHHPEKRADRGQGPRPKV
jgi:hypothetical protein